MEFEFKIKVDDDCQIRSKKVSHRQLRVTIEEITAILEDNLDDAKSIKYITECIERELGIEIRAKLEQNN